MSREDHDPPIAFDFAASLRESIERYAERLGEASIRIQLLTDAYFLGEQGEEVFGSGYSRIGETASARLGRYFSGPVSGTYGGDPGVSFDAMRPNLERADEIDELLADTVRMLEEGRR